MFEPNYGVANKHIEVLMTEREDFIKASKAQASIITQLKAELATANEQYEVQTLIAESRARQIEELASANAQKDAQVQKLRQAVKLLWGLHVSIQGHVAEGSELLESLDALLAQGSGTQNCEMSTPVSSPSQ
jgi:DNA repair exonuclease SbcCD ATPase subunit